MLILTRKIGESLIVGDNIRVVVLEVRGRQIRLGIEAPADVVVLREEIAQRLSKENLRAANFNYAEVQQAVKALQLKAGQRLGSWPVQPASPAITIESDALGQLSVPEDHLITFPAGLPGFAEAQRLALVRDHQESPLYFLQSVDDPTLTFAVTDPAALVADYRPKNGLSTLQDLEAGSPEDLLVLVTLTVPPGRSQEMTANLMSPLLINPRRGLGKQVVIEKPHYSHQYPLIPV